MAHFFLQLSERYLNETCGNPLLPNDPDRTADTIIHTIAVIFYLISNYRSIVLSYGWLNKPKSRTTMCFEVEALL